MRAIRRPGCSVQIPQLEAERNALAFGMDYSNLEVTTLTSNSIPPYITRAIIRKPVEDSGLTESELEKWAISVSLTLGDKIPTREDRFKVLQLVYQYRHLNGTGLIDLPPTDLITHRVTLVPGTKPHAVRFQKRWPPQKEWWLRKLIQDGLEGGIYERTETANGRPSEWNAQAVLVDKVENPGPHDEPRITFNFSKVNEQMPGTHLELVSKVHDYLSDPRHGVYMQADMTHGYYLISLHPDDRHYFAFTIPGIGQLQPTRMPQGSKSAGFTMSQLSNIMLGPISTPSPEPSLLHSDDPFLPPKIAFYQDDLLGGQRNFQEQYEFLRDHFFPRIEWANIRLSFKKLKLFMSSIKALGVTHLAGGRLQILEDRVRCIHQIKPPTNVTGVRAFLGTLGITRRWVRNYAEIARPLTRLTGKVPFRWGRSEALSFEILKIKCATRAQMYGIDWSIEVHFYSDVSKFGAGLVITQYQEQDHKGKPVEVPILYDAATLSTTERKYGTYKRELFAIFKFAKKYHYMLRHPSKQAIIHTDHKPLIRFLNSELLEGIYATWAAFLRPLNVEICYIPGPKNVVADGLSRTLFWDQDCEEDDIVRTVFQKLDAEGPRWIWKDGKGGFRALLDSLSEEHHSEVIEEGTLDGLCVFNAEVEDWNENYRQSTWFSDIFKFLNGELLSLPKKICNVVLDYRLKQGRLCKFWKGIELVCIPESKIRGVLEEAHDQNGHWGTTGTLTKLKGRIYWPGQAVDVKRYIDGCLECSLHRPAQRSQPLHPALVDGPFSLLGMDFIGPLRKTTKGNLYILHVIDYFSRFSFTKALPNNLVSDVIPFLTHLFKALTKPTSFYFDRGQHFDNDELRTFLKSEGVNFRYGPSGSSKSMGMVERGNRVLEDVLRKSSQEWDVSLPSSTGSVNERIIQHLGYSPIEILIGRPPPSVSSLNASWSDSRNTLKLFQSLDQGPHHSHAVADHLKNLSAIRAEASELDKIHKERLAQRYNRGVRIKTFILGEFVMLAQKHPSHKLGARNRGPFKILGTDGPNRASYRIEQLNGRRIKGTFHGDDLHRFVPRPDHLRGPNDPGLLTEQTIRAQRRHFR